MSGDILNMARVNQLITARGQGLEKELAIVGIQNAQAIFIEEQLRNNIEVSNDIVDFLKGYLVKAFTVAERETVSNALLRIADERVIDALIQCLKKNGEEPLNKPWRDETNKKIAATLTRVTGKSFIIGNTNWRKWAKWRSKNKTK